MRKIFSILLLAAVVLSIASCSKSDLTDKYADPGQTTQVTCPRLMSGVFYSGKGYTFNSYWRIFTWDYSGIARYSQTLGFLNNDGRYTFSDSYYGDRWNNFYTVLAQYRTLETIYSKLTDSDKSLNMAYLLCARIFLYDHLIQVADCWGAVPFSKAGYLPSTGVMTDATSTYDSDESIYESVLSDLKAVNASLIQVQASSFISTITSGLSSQDFINKGDLTKWRKYCNSLRLRVATEVADKGSLAAKGQAAIKEILADPTTYPLVESNAENIKVVPDQDGFNYASEYRDGWETWTGQLNRASKAMVDALSGDPRIDVIFDKNGSGNYVGVDPTTDFATQSSRFDAGNYYSSYDSATFSRNKNLPGIIISAAEVAFYKANAYNKAYATGGDAKAAFIKGMELSTEFYFGINALSSYRTPIAAPSTATVDAVAEAKWNAVTNKDEAISTQLWLNFGFLQTTQAWTAVRRTGYPVLYFPTDNTSSTVKDVPVRLRYPSTEKSYNNANYSAYSSVDNFTSKMFWAK